MRCIRVLPLIVLALAGVASAHETYFAPPPLARVGTPVVLSLSSGMGFPGLGSGPKASRVAQLSARSGTLIQPVEIKGNTAAALRIALTPERAGLMAVTIDLAPMPIELNPAKVAEYFAEIEPSAAVRAAYENQPAPRRWNELYAKHAKLLLCVAPCLDTVAATTPAGQRLEFVAQDSSLRRFVLLENGKPRAGQLVELLGQGKPQRLHTGSDGILSLPDAAKGDLLLSTTIVRAPAKPGAPFTSDFATVSFKPR